MPCLLGRWLYVGGGVGGLVGNMQFSSPLFCSSQVHILHAQILLLNALRALCRSRSRLLGAYHGHNFANNLLSLCGGIA